MQTFQLAYSDQVCAVSMAKCFGRLCAIEGRRVGLRVVGNLATRREAGVEFLPYSFGNHGAKTQFAPGQRGAREVRSVGAQDDIERMVRVGGFELREVGPQGQGNRFGSGLLSRIGAMMCH